jgi:hypothetical protein
MRRRLSSLQTFLIKVIFPIFWTTIWGIGTVVMFFTEEGKNAPPKFIFLLIWIIGIAFLYWSCIRLKAVSVDEDFLYVSNYLREISIPLSNIYDVTENRWINIHPVTIHLKSPSEFGDKIIFMPKVRVFSLFSSHPVVAELKELARMKSMEAGFTR